MKRTIVAVLTVSLLAGCGTAKPEPVFVSPTTPIPVSSFRPTPTHKAVLKPKIKPKTINTIKPKPIKTTKPKFKPAVKPNEVFVHPGSYCSASLVGSSAKAKNGKLYTCKGPKPYRWRAL